ncbi:MAG: proteasome accessory factor PafA2 family protein, partial [Limisphaerales bacterium]
MKPESELIKKTTGGDFEITAFIEGDPTGTGSAPLAAQILLAQVKGIAALHSTLRVIREVKEGEGPPPGGYYHTLDWGRVFLPTNGSSIYIDCDHLELAMAEVWGARQHYAAMRAMFLIVRDAMDRVNAALPPGQRLRVLLNNVDAHGNCFGTHLNFSCSTGAFHNIVRHEHGRHIQFLASWNATSMLLGQGRAGSEDGKVSYQFSQRADFIDHLLSENTQFPPGRPLVNARNEAHTGINSGMARLHDIVHDNNLCQTGAVLKVGLMEIVLCMIES